jgi:hypothetical protein
LTVWSVASLTHPEVRVRSKPLRPRTIAPSASTARSRATMRPVPSVRDHRIAEEDVTSPVAMPLGR